jgi:hypothetical protein
VSRVKRRLKFFVDGAWEERLLVQWVTSIMIAVHWGLGLSVLVGGQARFTIPTYQPLIDLTNGHVWIWGVAIMLSAFLMTMPWKVPTVVGTWLGMVWMIMWASLFSVSLLQYPQAAATPVVAYAGFAMINAALLTARLLERPEKE